ncbi:hypothetical protein Vretimale_18604 [Volvox reticuliferus]|uniref:Uncharacterized protein n=1 Tax=Volvox reticuliferus TaxID=1737510 RepID=A0A8J4FYC6_9CHLO|nr:hypothetical protein Vretifemale_17062 [Volvox reticuliferus]GIM15942.1 hypothetical protein Vretimale_18604 [Volvox reticuliferus]
MALSRVAFGACKRLPETRCFRCLLSHKRRTFVNIQRSGPGWQGLAFSRMIRVGASVVGEQGDGQPQQAVIEGPLYSIMQFAAALYKFSRPHTMMGTALSVTSISLLALAGSEPGLVAITALLHALSSALLMNIAIVGINQLYDIEIDKVNKPYLPLASGALTPAQGAAIVALSAGLATWIGTASGSPALMATLFISLGLGVLYSAELPFMRWKRSPLLAAGCILVVRAIIVQLGFYTHMRAALDAAASVAAGGAAATGAAAAVSGALGSLFALRPCVWFVVVFMMFFSVVIAFFKDLPDVVGDRRAGVRTLPVRLGESSVFRICVGMLTAAYAWAMAASLTLPTGAAAKAALLAGHGLLVALLLGRARSVDTGSKADLTNYYMFVWKLFYAEYLLIPLFG